MKFFHAFNRLRGSVSTETDSIRGISVLVRIVNAKITMLPVVVLEMQYTFRHLTSALVFDGPLIPQNVLQYNSSQIWRNPSCPRPRKTTFRKWKIGETIHYACATRKNVMPSIDKNINSLQLDTAKISFSFGHIF